MDLNNKGTIAIVGWLSYLATILYLANTLGPVAIPFAAIMIAPLIVLMNFLFGKKSVEELMEMGESTEKRKRERIDNMIRDMSDEDLYELRRRLQSGTYDEDLLYEHVVGDDGELVRR